MKAVALIAALCGATPALAHDAAPPPAKAVRRAPAMPLRLLPMHPPRVPRSPRAALTVAIPEQFAPPQEAYASFPEAAPAPVQPSACDERLAKIATFKPLPILAGPGECGAADAVLLESVTLFDNGSVAIAPPAMLRCSMAETVAAWLREDVAPTALKLGAPLRGLDNFDSYECRGRNRVRGATLSEHGRANALDVRAFTLANGQTIELTDVNVAKDWREGIRGSACARFSTVLGPGSDGNHEQHVHIDLVDRRGGYKTCEWDVREPVKQVERTETKGVQQNAEIDGSVPLPRPRPVTVAAPAGPQPTKKSHAQLR